MEVVLARRPGADKPLEASVFDVREASPAPPSEKDHIVVKLRWLSVDPYLRCRFNEDTGVEYTLPYQVGKPLSSAAVGVVDAVKSDDPDFVAKYQPGTLVHGLDVPWATTTVFERPTGQADGPALSGFPDVVPAPLAAQGEDATAQMVLSVVGVTGLTAYFGVEEAFGVPVRQLMAAAPEEGPVAVVVSSVAGGTGSVFAAICKAIPGVRVIGLTSTDAKARAVEERGLVDAALAYRNFEAAGEDGVGKASLTEAIHHAAGMPVAAYFDSVGGWISTQVFRAMRPGGRVVMCGQISRYNDDVPYPPPLSDAAQAAVAAAGLKRERYLVLRYQQRFVEAQEHLATLVAAGVVPMLTTVREGLANAPAAMIGVMSGENVGKMLVKC